MSAPCFAAAKLVLLIRRLNMYFKVVSRVKPFIDGLTTWRMLWTGEKTSVIEMDGRISLIFNQMKRNGEKTIPTFLNTDSKNTN